MAVEISVIVPVYNVEKTLDRCIESILNQSFTNYEVILVDDGSTDDSGLICDNYAKKHPNFKVIHKHNEGLGPTRNRGIMEASGEFIYHCDSDDWLKEDLLEKSYHAITENNADVCIFGYDIFTEKNGEITPFDSIKIPSGKYYSKKDVRQLFVEQYYNSFIVMSACNRMYRKAFLINNNLFFPNLRRSQDMAYSLFLFDNLERLVTLNECYYCYIIEPGVFKGRSFSEMLTIYQQINEMASEQFIKWHLFDKKQKILLNNRTCESVANYSAYAFVTKYPEQRDENIKALLSNKKISGMFANYVNTKHSKFLMLFCVAMRLKSRKLLWLVSKWHERKKNG